jgi:hypothetical protein
VKLTKGGQAAKEIGYGTNDPTGKAAVPA